MLSNDDKGASEKNCVTPGHEPNASSIRQPETGLVPTSECADVTVKGAKCEAELTVLSHSVLSVPQWVARILQMATSKVAILETTASSRRYQILLQYLAHRAVDFDSDFVPEAPVEGREPLKSRRLEAQRREYPGQLSVLSTGTSSQAVHVAPPPSAQKPPKSSDDDSDESEPEPDYPALQFGLGRARLRHNGEDVCVLHSITGSPSRSTYKAVYLYARHPDTLRSLLNEVTVWNFERSRPLKTPRAGKYQLYTLKARTIGSKWKYQGWKKSRPLDSIFLDDGMMDNIVSDIRRFTSKDSKKFYRNHGIPYKRSHIFYGPAGTGKTSTIRALAGTLNLSACFCELNGASITNAQFQDALRTMPQPAMLVIEDIDAVFKPNREVKGAGTRITFSGVLNALDGLVSADGVLTVLTTNHLERLDPALIRAGRIDRRFKFEPPKKKQIAAMFRSFYPDDDDKEFAQEFADAVMERPEKEARSIATLVEHMLHTCDMSAAESVQYLDTFFKEFYPGSVSNSSNWMYS